MNLISTYTPNYLTKLPVAVVIIFIFSACEDPNGIGLDFQGKLPIETVYTDTLTIDAGTVWQDSSFTSGSEGIAVGRYEDPIFGTVTSAGYTLVNLPVTSAATKDSFKFDLKTENYAYDSIALVMKYNNFTYGDTTSRLKLSVHRLTGDFNQNKRYVGSESINYNPVALGTSSFTIRDLKNIKGDTAKFIRIKLNDDFGRELWSLANKPEGLNVVKFTALMKGLAIVPSADTKMLANLKFSDATTYSSSLSIYSHENGKTDKLSSEFTLTRPRFSSVNSVLNGLPLNKRFTKGKIQTAAAANNRIFVQGGTGLTTRLSIPSLTRIITQGKVAINRAELIIEPVAGIATDFYYLPKFLQLSETSKTEDLQIYRNAAGVPFVATNATLSKTLNSYSFNMTDYIQKIVEKKKTSNSFLVSIPTNDEVSRVVLNPKSAVIKIYYTVSKN